MSLDVWLAEDVERACHAAAVAGYHARAEMGRCAQSSAVEMESYWRGYAAALATLRAAFGIAGEEEAGGVPVALAGFPIEIRVEQP